MRTSRRTIAATIAGAATLALVVTGCSAGGGDSSDEPVTLTLATFNDFGYTDELLAEFTAETGITVIHNKAATSNDARANYFQKLGNSGLADVEAVEIDWFTEAMQYSDLLAPVADDLKGRWLDWKEAAATDAAGNLIAYGTDIGPQGICYRSDLFAAAGLPTDRAEVAKLFDGDWDNFFSIGAQYTATTGKPFIDSANSVLQGIVNQYELAYEDTDGSIIATTNPDIEAAYKAVVEKAIPISAYSGQWSEDWFASMASGEFAAMLCPGWMLGVISGNAPDITGWDIADAFPGGGGNWGGSYLTVPANGAHVKEAAELAAWLTSPETQLKAFTNAGTFPSQVDALASDELAGATNEYFNNAPTGTILTDRANAITVATFKGPKYFQFHDALQNAVTRVFDGLEDEQTSWNNWVTEVSAF
ncbi:MAG: carbohydrate ABC transporter substrate-binding protein [Microbacteriaceae bacterium]|nr:carbohydrate ABC transporter substrate-binding protein [Microbacteriaceae bacterium]HOB56094.1 ABC transporter substrate-binding protein [Rhodoglobus sp.]HOT33242.1 ABC transporter substrate-binding protein [Rhodoglobus sp.]HOY80790.1 ABC transporter substrate-binding protein [Rhodoglobus sp.]HPG74782.1 ABC transporter substrate-binding protein [Rhodoglobus sp.]